MGIASLVLGIIGLVAMLTPIPFFGAITGIILCLLAMILGIVARKNLAAAQQPTGAATAGMIMGIIGSAMGAVVLVACISCAACVGAGLNEAGKTVDNRFKEGTDSPAMKKALDDLDQQMKQAPTAK